MRLIKNSRKEILPTKNGVVNQELIDFIKTSMMYDSVRNIKNYVKENKDYPDSKNNTVKVDFNLEFVIMSREEFDYLNNGDT